MRTFRSQWQPRRHAISPSTLTATWWVTNPRPAATFVHCVHNYYTNYTIIWAVWYSTLRFFHVRSANQPTITAVALSQKRLGAPELDKYAKPPVRLSLDATMLQCIRNTICYDGPMLQKCMDGTTAWNRILTEMLILTQAGQEMLRILFT